jgi:arylsulfatase
VAACVDTLRSDDPRIPSLFAESPRANVLVVSFDALRADHLELYGYTRRTSPAMTAFARAAVVFEEAWSPSSSTPSSFAGMWSAAVPSRVFQRWKLVDTPTLAGHFARAGYSTAFFSNNTQLVAERGFDRGFTFYEVLARSAGDADEDGVADDEEVLRRSLEWLRAVEPPFLLWVHLLSPHSPYRVRSPSGHLYDRAYSGRFESTSGHHFEAHSEEELRRLRDLYDGEIFFADRLFEQLLAGLGESRHEASTVVVLTSDHGEAFGEHGDLQHAGVYEEALRVPFVIRAPGTAPQRVAQQVSLLDLAPTLAELVGLAPFPARAGVSLQSSRDGNRLRVAVSMTHRTDHYLAAARGPHKLALDCRRQTRRLYDLSRDPGESRSIEDEQPRLARGLARDLARVLGGEPCTAVAAAARGASPGEGIGAEARATLAALGYLNQGDGFVPHVEKPVARRLWADPNPTPDCDGSGRAATTLHWRFPPEWGAVEVRVEPGGGLFAAAGGEGSAPTGRWVVDGLRFVASGASPDERHVVEMAVVRGDCRTGE